MSKVIGHIVSIRGLVCDVELIGERPVLNELLTVKSTNNDSTTEVEVIGYPGAHTVRCLNIAASAVVCYGSNVTAPGATSSLPVGQ